MPGPGAASSTTKGGIKAYWKRRGYDRADAAAAQRRPRLPTAELGGGGDAVPAPAPARQQPRRRRRGWRVRGRGLGRRVLRALSPRRMLARLRDAYVNAMLRLASSAAVAGYGGGGAAPYCTAGDPFARPRPLVREYDEKALVEMYRAILARGEAAPVLAAARMPAVV